MTTPNQSLPVLLKKVQATINLYVRLRDAGKPCVSCGSMNTEHASHFYSMGHHSSLRFNTDNIHAACKRCNYFLGGNLIPYRKELINRIGQERFDLLESIATRQRIKKWGRLELEQLLIEFKQKIKSLQ